MLCDDLTRMHAEVGHLRHAPCAATVCRQAASRFLHNIPASTRWQVVNTIAHRSSVIGKTPMFSLRRTHLHQLVGVPEVAPVLGPKVAELLLSTRWGPARCKDVIRVLECLKHREPAGTQRASQKHRSSNDCVQARQSTRAQSGAASASAAHTTTCEAKRESLK